MGDSTEWTSLVLVVLVIAALLARPYFNKRRAFKPIAPESRQQWNTWPCPSCGARNYPEERTEDGRRFRGTCSACRKTWEANRRGS
jgi:hypothetical protein